MKNSKDFSWMLGAWSIISILLVLLSVIFFSLVFAYPSFKMANPTLFFWFLLASFLISTTAIILITSILVKTRRKQKNPFKESKNLVFLFFGIIAFNYWLMHLIEFAGILQKRWNALLVNSPIYGIFSFFGVLAFISIPALCLLILIIEALQLVNAAKKRRRKNG
jgi:hypothetical protein